jgi:RecA/RadA recombinase
MHLILGGQGSGKTLLLVALAYKAWKQGKTVYSNVALKFPYKELQYQDIIDCNLKDAVCVIDEIHQLLPARNSMSKINREICDSFISMIRKQNLDVYGTTQTARKVDVRFRDETDYLYICRKYAYEHGRWGAVEHNQNLDISVPVLIDIEVTNTQNSKMINLKLKGNQFFKLYDTTQVIQVKGIKLKGKDRREEALA